MELVFPPVHLLGPRLEVERLHGVGFGADQPVLLDAVLQGERLYR